MKMRWVVGRFAVLMALLAVVAQAQSPTPYRPGASQPLKYNGPGREEPEPTDLKTVDIGFFGPTGPGESESLWLGASLAVEEANKNGGYRGLPFQLVSSWADNPWNGGASKLIQSIYKDRLWAIIGGIDGATTHLAEQVTTKLQITLINPVASDRSIHAANVPWMFSCVPGDQLQAGQISSALTQSGTTFAILSSTEHDARAFVAELKTSFAHDKIAPVIHVEFEKGSAEAQGIVQRLLESKAAGVIVAAPAPDTLAVIRSARQAGFGGTIYAGASLARLAPDSSLKGVIIPVLGDIDPRFRQAYQVRYGHAPDYGAAHAFDAANIVIAAIRKAGLNRARIRDAVRALSPYEGASGRIEWDPVGQNQRPVVLEAIGEEKR